LAGDDFVLLRTTRVTGTGCEDTKFFLGGVIFDRLSSPVLRFVEIILEVGLVFFIVEVGGDLVDGDRLVLSAVGVVNAVDIFGDAFDDDADFVLVVAAVVVVVVVFTVKPLDVLLRAHGLLVRDEKVGASYP
jgi:hypothetical protein